MVQSALVAALREAAEGWTCNRSRVNNERQRFPKLKAITIVGMQPAPSIWQRANQSRVSPKHRHTLPFSATPCAVNGKGSEDCRFNCGDAGCTAFVPRLKFRIDPRRWYCGIHCVTFAADYLQG
jgi:hypothetical protein